MKADVHSADVFTLFRAVFLKSMIHRPPIRISGNEHSSGKVDV